MPISNIKSIAPAGSFESQHGTLYKFHLTLEDGTIGEANAKSDKPWYGVGSQVSYEVTKETKFGKNLKVSKPEGGNVQYAPAKTYGAAPAAAKAAAMEKRDESINASWAIGRAVEIYLACKKEHTAAYPSHIYHIAKKLLHIHECICEGRDFDAELPND